MKRKHSIYLTPYIVRRKTVASSIDGGVPEKGLMPEPVSFCPTEEGTVVVVVVVGSAVIYLPVYPPGLISCLILRLPFILHVSNPPFLSPVARTPSHVPQQ
ncbi:hypothetical protein E2C01_041927 [Portunus trituberculatus]|uniref:Uncharacterized protein n=1 Tax=Portunus trituberculatus TaxID=210409 RepID=A0A5B7FSB0_PORTR|nr:hypothetical protein [Portunus trituberculatus]